MRYLAIFTLLTSFVFAVAGCTGSDVAITVDIYEDPGGEDGRVEVENVKGDDDNFELEYRFDCEPLRCNTECRLPDHKNEWFDCESPVTFTEDSEQIEDLEEGYLIFEVRGYDEEEEEVSPADEVDTLVLEEFDFGLVDTTPFESGDEVYFPDEYDATCSRDDCQITCWFESEELADPVDVDCSLDDPFEVEYPGEEPESAMLNVEACATDFGGRQDDEYCNGPKEYLFYPPPPAWTSLDAGARHTCGIVEDGSLWCWGDNNAGQLGIDSDQADSQTAAKVLNRDWTQVSVGDEHTCAINESGELFCWGVNGSEQLGFEPVNQRQPEQVSDENDPNDAGPWSVVAAGGSHTCAIHADSEGLYCWGANSQGQLGIGDEPGSSDFREVSLPEGTTNGWVDVSAGEEHTCGVAYRNGGGSAAYCWGNAGSGRLGNNTTSGTYDTPQEVQGDLTVGDTNEISASNEHTCAVATLNNNRESYCWGMGSAGRLGVGGDQNWPTPRGVEGSDNHVDVATGDEHSCALGPDDQVYCWGEGIRGQLGHDSEDPSDVPVGVAAPEGVSFSAVAAGNEHSCAISTRGVMYCWGRPDNGRLGAHVDGDSDIPLELDWPQGEFVPEPDGE